MESAPLDMEVPKTNSSFTDDASEKRSILRSGMSNTSGALQVSFQKNLKSNEKGLPESWKLPASSVEIPMQKCWGKASSPCVLLDERHKLQVKNTFFDVVSLGGSEKSNEEPKVMSWTDERAGLSYGSYQQWQGPQLRTTRSKSSISGHSQVSGLGTSSISSHTGSILSEFSSEGDPTGEMLVVLGGRTQEMKECDVRLSEFQQVPRHPTTGEITSIGSAGHFCGTCKPCEWMQRGRPCKYGWRCTYCHIIDDHERYSRKNRQSNGKQRQIPMPCSFGEGSLVNCSNCKISL
jgi:hypothetical protein